MISAKTEPQVLVEEIARLTRQASLLNSGISALTEQKAWADSDEELAFISREIDEAVGRRDAILSQVAAKEAELKRLLESLGS